MLWFLMTNTEDDTSYKTMMLLSSKHFGSLLLNEEGEGGGKLMLDSVFCMELPSRYGRDALCMNIAAPAVSGTIYHLLNVHLNSLDSHFQCALQMLALAPSCTSPDVGVGSLQATSMQSSLRIIYELYHQLGIARPSLGLMAQQSLFGPCFLIMICTLFSNLAFL